MAPNHLWLSAVRAARLAALVGLAVSLMAGCKRHHKPKLSWGMGVQTFDATALGLAASRSPDPFVDGIHAGRILIPTYDGGNQATHPDVVLERDAAGGLRLIMAMTPYPFSNDRFENPSLLVSRDGMTFAPPAGVVNPLVPAPRVDHNNDPDLRRDPRTGDYELLYLETLRPENKQTLVALRSPDLVAWTRRDAVVYDFTKGAPFIVSPAAIEEGGKTYLFSVDPEGKRVQLMISDDGRTWDVAAAKTLPIDFGAVKPWHVDVVRAEIGFAMLISGFDTVFTAQNLYLATSPDLVTWTLRARPLLDHADPMLGVESLYRSTGLVEHGTLIVWYSMQYHGDDD